MTWGRQNGDAQNCPIFPPVCTYSGMDSLIRLRYRALADSQHALIAPVGPVWRYLRNTLPSVNLYDADGSHPSLAGAYAAALTIATVITHQNPAVYNTWNNAYPSNASDIANAVKTVVYDSLLYWNVGKFDPLSVFSYAVSAGSTVSFDNNSENAATYSWDFGDGSTDTLAQPVHTYSGSGAYTVRLIASKCNKSDTSFQSITINTTGINSLAGRDQHFSLSPNPASNSCTLQAPSGLEETMLSITNMLGMEVLNSKIKSGETFWIAALPVGMYTVSVFQKHGCLARLRLSIVR
jgi:PKD repeat protein